VSLATGRSQPAVSYADSGMSNAKKPMGDSEHSDSDEQSRIKTILRIASFALPSFVTIFGLLDCWRRHFNMQSIESAGLLIALSLYLAVFLHRRSRGLAASYFYASNGPDRDETSRENLDVIAVLGAAVLAGTVAYGLFKHW
jgi:hypothetical protein